MYHHKYYVHTCIRNLVDFNLILAAAKADCQTAKFSAQLQYNQGILVLHMTTVSKTLPSALKQNTDSCQKPSCDWTNWQLYYTQSVINWIGKLQLQYKPDIQTTHYQSYQIHTWWLCHRYLGFDFASVSMYTCTTTSCISDNLSSVQFIYNISTYCALCCQYQRLDSNSLSFIILMYR